MRLYLLRHAIAEEGAGIPDSQRQLTPSGRKKLHKILERAAEAGLQPDFVLCSPYARARQTAEMAAEVLKFNGELIHSENFTPYSSPHKAWDEIREYRNAAQLLVAGHNPHLSDLVSLLTGARAGAVEMRKAGLACLELISAGPEPRATLNWLLTPRSCGV